MELMSIKEISNLEPTGPGFQSSPVMKMTNNRVPHAFQDC